MKTASIICTFALLSLLSLVLSATKRDGFVILLDNSYRAEIVAESENVPEFPASQLYKTVPHNDLRRAVENEENSNPQSILQTGDTIYLADGKSGKLSRFSPADGLKAIAVFGGNLKKLQSIASDSQGNIYLSVQSDSKGQDGHLIKLKKVLEPFPN